MDNIFDTLLSTFYTSTFQEKNDMIGVSDLTLTQTRPGFHVSAVQVFWKHCGKKEKLLVKSNFSFFPQCFLPIFIKLSAIFVKFEIVVCKLFQFGRV